MQYNQKYTLTSNNYQDMDMIKHIYATKDGIDLKSDNPSCDTIHVTEEESKPDAYTSSAVSCSQSGKNFIKYYRYSGSMDFSMAKYLALLIVILFSASVCLAAKKTQKFEEPVIIALSPEEFLAKHTPKHNICYSCVSVEGDLIDYCLIKGNVNKKKHIYHCPNWRDYDKTYIDIEEGERYFYTEEEATASGWIEPKYKKGPCLVGIPYK